MKKTPSVEKIAAAKKIAAALKKAALKKASAEKRALEIAEVIKAAKDKGAADDFWYRRRKAGFDADTYISQDGRKRSGVNKFGSRGKWSKRRERSNTVKKYIPPSQYEIDDWKGENRSSIETINSSSEMRNDTFESNYSSDKSDDEVKPKSGKISNHCKKNYANYCRPQYSYPLESINWSKCNMKNWYTPYSKKYLTYKKYCKNNKTKKSYPPNISVGAKVLHKKFPYIWRFLNKKTQKKIIQLAQLPVNMINIWPNTKNPLYIKKNKMINKILNKN